MLGRRAKAVVLATALVVLAVEGVLLVRYYDRYYVSEPAPGARGGASGTASSSVPASEGTMPEGTTADPGEPVDEEDSFVHVATGANSRGDYTVLDHRAINGDPYAIVLVEPAPDLDSAGEGAYDHNIGVWYVPGARKWAIFNQDLAPVPAGSAFEVVVPPQSEGFVERLPFAFGGTNGTYLDEPLVNGKPDVVLTITQNWNPGGGAGVYNDYPVGVLYDAERGRWLVYNTDLGPMREGGRLQRGGLLAYPVLLARDAPDVGPAPHELRRIPLPRTPVDRVSSSVGMALSASGLQIVR